MSDPNVTIMLTEDEHLATIEVSARALCKALTGALDGGVSQVKVMPMLIGILKEEGLFPEGMSLPFGFGR